MLWMINSFPIKALNLLELSAVSHAGAIFPVSDTSSLGGDSAQGLSWRLGFGTLGSVLLQEAPQSRGRRECSRRQPGAQQSCHAGSALSHSRCLHREEDGKVLRQFPSALSLWLWQSGCVSIRDFWLEGLFSYFSEEKKGKWTAAGSVWALCVHQAWISEVFPLPHLCFPASHRRVTGVGRFSIFTLCPTPW